MTKVGLSLLLLIGLMAFQFSSAETPKQFFEDVGQHIKSGAQKTENSVKRGAYKTKYHTQKGARKGVERTKYTGRKTKQNVKNWKNKHFN